MRLSPPLFNSQASFHRQLFLIIAVGVTLLAVVASITTAWVTSRQVRSLLVTEGEQVTRNLAEQSVLALLYGSGENAADAAHTTLSFPSIEHVAIFDRNQVAILEEGNEDARPIAIESTDWTTSEPRLMRDLHTAWHFVAPVYTPVDQSEEANALFPAGSAQQELLGYVYVIMRKDELRRIQLATFVNNISIALFIEALLLLLLHATLSRLTNPLHELSTLMNRAEQGDTTVTADVHGPREIEQIASAFNTMIESLAERDKRLREHNLRLESEVSLRTSELVHARDAALEASRHKSEFLANISHELRTPLQSIIGYSDVLIETLEDEGLDEYIGDIDRILLNAQHLLSLINSILALSKIESGQMELKIEPVDLRKILEQAEETVLPLTSANRNRLEVQVQECGEPLEIDGGKILQILLNLLSNAAKFTEAGEITARIQHDPDELSIVVSDTGIGISKEQQSIVFDPFRQVDGSVTRTFQGTGLGLSITQRFCRLMGGDITVDSQLGHGARFIVSIPLPLRPAANAYVATQTEEAAMPSSRQA